PAQLEVLEDEPGSDGAADQRPRAAWGDARAEPGARGHQRERTRARIDAAQAQVAPRARRLVEAHDVERVARVVVPRLVRGDPVQRAERLGREQEVIAVAAGRGPRGVSIIVSAR